MSKRVSEVDEYEFRGTDYVLVTTEDGWHYRFNRPNEHEPYTFEKAQRPDGTPRERDTSTPRPVVEFMFEHYDAAQLHPESKRSGYRWGDRQP